MQAAAMCSGVRCEGSEILQFYLSYRCAVKMVQKYQSPVRVYKYPFELVMAVSNTQHFYFSSCYGLQAQASGRWGTAVLASVSSWQPYVGTLQDQRLSSQSFVPSYFSVKNKNYFYGDFLYNLYLNILKETL